MISKLTHSSFHGRRSGVRTFIRLLQQEWILAFESVVFMSQPRTRFVLLQAPHKMSVCFHDLDEDHAFKR